MVYEKGADDGGRTRLLETIRQYAGDRLQESGEAEEVQGQAASWFLRLAEEASPQLIGSKQALWLGRLETEHDNLRVSLTWYEHLFERGGEFQIEGAEGGLRLTGALWRFWLIHGHYSEGRQWLERALNHKTLGRGPEGSVGRESKAIWGMATVRRTALNGAGNLAVGQGDFTVARALYEESLTIARQLGNQQGIAASLNNLGNVAYNQGDYAAGRAMYEESLTIARQLGDQQRIAQALNNLGNMTSDQGDYAGARAFHEESLAIVRQLGDQQRIAHSLNNLGTVASEQGDYSVARVLYEESLTIARRLGDQVGIASSLGNLGTVASEQGDYARARTLHGESLSILRQLGAQVGIVSSLEGIARLAHRQHQLPKAGQLWGAASSLRETLGSHLPSAEDPSNKWIASVREALGDLAFNAAWDAGWAMTLDEAVEYALREG